MAILDDILSQIKLAKTIIIHRHQRPDPDAIGSQLGLRDILRASFPEKTVLAAGAEGTQFTWIGDADPIEDDQFKDALVIVVDTANQPRVEDERWATGQTIVKIDHHPNDDAFGDFQWVKPAASSTSELISDFQEAFSSELTMTAQAARSLYAGIVGDTGRFMYPSTSSHTMAVTSYLMTYDFSADEINRIEDEITIPMARLSAYAYENLTILPSGAAYLKLTDEIVEPFNLPDHSTNAVVPLPGRIQDVVSWAIFVETKEKTFRVRLRSKGPSINEIAKAHNGGGHALASGANAADQAEIDQIIKELDALDAAYKGEQ